jgi:alkylhydroperoxidase/carboxymuconolactone decarboxylase family protein YurZ
METAKVRSGQRALVQDKTEILIAIGAATGTNCIPCFEHIYEKAINTGVTLEEIKRASDIAAQVKKGAHIALTNVINELTEIEERQDLPCEETTNKSCCG